MSLDRGETGAERGAKLADFEARKCASEAISGKL